MPELVINVPSYIGESHMDWLDCKWVEGITWADIDMQLWWAEAMGEKADSILLRIGACDGGSALEGFNIINNLRALNLPIRSHVSGYAASMAVPLALAADVAPEMDYTAQLMFHAASFNGGVGAETSKDLRAAADQLDNANQLLLDFMVARTGQTPETVTQWMSKDTWFTATQAQAAGLCSTVNPLPAATTPTAAAAMITARRRRVPMAAARAASYALTARPKPSPKATSAAHPAAPSLRPMTKVAKPITAAAGKKPAAAKPAAPAKPAALSANQQLVANLAKQLGVSVQLDGLEAPTAELQNTELDNGALLYHDGALAVDVAVFNDEALTEATGDGDYDAADGRVISVASGIVTAIEDAEAEAQGTEQEPAASTAALTAAITAALAPVTKRLDEMEASFKKVVPPTPRPLARGAQSPDAKVKPKPKPKASHHSTL
ncbi:ATP-dependent Clp protease proteolytic subunit [Hymenobacter sp. B81]|uniref:ATP-dependent Clp protease proteolytic subunit n=1 Tax=Hymenobacter sp. B81 TaxID=3344878 RepID=UPI0037DCAA4F